MEDIETDLKIVGRQMLLLPRKNATVLKYMCDCPRSPRSIESPGAKSSRQRRIYAYLQSNPEQDPNNYSHYVTTSDPNGTEVNSNQPFLILSSTSSIDSNSELKLIHLDMHGTMECNSEGEEVRVALCSGSHESITEELQRLKLESQLCCPVIVCEHVDDITDMTDIQAEIDFRQGQARLGALARLSVPAVDIADEKRRPPLPGSEELIKTWWRG